MKKNRDFPGSSTSSYRKIMINNPYKISISEIIHSGGFAWLVKLPDEIPFGDNTGRQKQSNLILFENGLQLGPRHSPHEYIRKVGKGSYSHWNDTLYFSTSDNSKPQENGREYILKDAAQVEQCEERWHQYPYIVGIETINTCNARCIFCPLFQGQAMMDRNIRPAQVMNQELFAKCVNEIGGWPVKPITLFLNMNGEPLQDPLFSDRLSLVGTHHLGSIIDLLTNAQFLTDNVAHEILKTNIRSLVIGFDGASKEVYEAHRIHCDYDRVLENIKAFTRLRDTMGVDTRIYIKYVRTKRNQHEVFDAYSMFNEFLDAELDIFQDVLAIDWGVEQFKTNQDIYYRGKIGTNQEPIGCETFDQQLIISSDGAIQACCWDYNLGVSDGGFGNANEADLLSLWLGEKRNNLRNRLFTKELQDKPETCRTCNSMFEQVPVDKSLAILQGDLMDAMTTGFLYRFSRMKGREKGK
jgi:hypothetical protein